MTCKHDWQVVTIESHADGRVLHLFCEFCRSSAHVELTATECDDISARMDDLAARRPGEDLLHMMTMHDMIHDLVNRPDMQARVWIRSTHDGGDDEDDLHPAGTMSWTVIDGGEFNDDAAAEFQAHVFGLAGQDAPADDWQAHEFDHLDGDAPAECNHTWHVRGVAAEEAADSEIELYCLRCHEWARVPDLTDYECELIGRAWLLGLALEWQDNKRVRLHRDAPAGATGHTSLDDPDMPVDQPRPPVADLVDGLDLFEGDDDVPF